MKKINYLLLLSLFLCSCKKNSTEKFETPPTQKDSKVQFYKEQFAKILAIAVEREPELRSFIKNEAQKQFDLDNDILYQMVKDQKISNNESFHQKLLKYASNKDELNVAIEKIPTLTIMVPELPNFNPTDWNTTNETPEIAVSPEKINANPIIVYNSNGKIVEIPRGYIPAFPVLVVKENERINVKVNGINKSPASAVLLKSENENTQSAFFSNERLEFSFSNANFDGLSSKRITQINDIGSSNGQKVSRIIPIIVGMNGNTIPTNHPPVDQSTLAAYELNMDWQRDYIYYGLNPSAGVLKGKFNNRMVETIVSIRMADNTIDRISNHSEDPTLNTTTVPSNWTDGYFDFRITIFINSKNGGGQTLNKVISARGSDLYDIEYKPISLGGRPLLRFNKLIPKEFFINERIVSWDLENYGATWKIVVSEYDPAEEIILSKSETVKFANNFSFDISLGEKVKNNIKFGSTLETTSTSSYQYKTTRGSDDLGEGIIEFGSPIIIRKETVAPNLPTPGRPARQDNHLGGIKYVMNEVSCGQIFLSIEPRRL